jgi:hypothetical protein
MLVDLVNPADPSKGEILINVDDPDDPGGPRIAQTRRGSRRAVRLAPQIALKQTSGSADGDKTE